jgi:DNA-directed RNA polymerase subunit omega
MKLMNGFDSNYRYVIAAARRARQITGGAPLLVDTSARKPCKIAQEEIAAGKIHLAAKEQAEAEVKMEASPAEPAPETSSS